MVAFTQARPARDYGPGAVVLEWDEYERWLEGTLRTVTAPWGERIQLPKPPDPGEHEAHIGPTGDGKSTHCVRRLGVRKYVLALDAKGGDETLSESGFVRVGSLYEPNLAWRWRHRDDAKTWDLIWRNITEGRPARVIVGGPADTREQLAALRDLMQEAVEWTRGAGGWTVYLDEFEVMSSREIFNLARDVNHSLITARHRKVSILTAYQAQAWVSWHAVRQARRAVIWPTGDRKMIANVAQAMGRDWRQVAEAVDTLPPFHSLTIPRGPRSGPMIVTSAPQLGKGAPHADTGSSGRGTSRPGSDRNLPERVSRFHRQIRP